MKWTLSDHWLWVRFTMAISRQFDVNECRMQLHCILSITLFNNRSIDLLSKKKKLWVEWILLIFDFSISSTNVFCWPFWNSSIAIVHRKIHCSVWSWDAIAWSCCWDFSMSKMWLHLMLIRRVGIRRQFACNYSRKLIECAWKYTEIARPTSSTSICSHFARWNLSEYSDFFISSSANSTRLVFCSRISFRRFLNISSRT